MKRAALICLMLATAWLLRADSTISSTNCYAYSGNTGWLNLHADGTHGAVVGRWYSTGSIWSPSIGWLTLGSGTPANGWSYANDSATDWGINHDGAGALTGFAYGANVGWINFEQQYGKPQIDLATGRLSGAVWGANIGWITLSNEMVVVSTERLANGPDLDRDGLPDIWEYKVAGDLGTLDGNHDTDGDGLSDGKEFLVGTDPLDPDSFFGIVEFQHRPGTDLLRFTTVPDRVYSVYTHDNVPPRAPELSVQRLQPGTDPIQQVILDNSDASQRFYQIKVSLPLP